MLAELVSLVDLQKLDDEIRALQTRLAAIPKEIEALEAEIATERRNLEDAKKTLLDAQKAQRGGESELATTEEKLRKYRDQLMNVKSNDEYRAMQKQIDGAQLEVSDIEDKILHGLDALEALETARQGRQAELEKGQREIGAMENELVLERTRLEGEPGERQAKRSQILASIPDDLLEDYDRIGKVRGGVAVAEAIDEHCQVCMVRLRPQVSQELRLGEKILHCESCRRILYFRKEEQAAAT